MDISILKNIGYKTLRKMSQGQDYRSVSAT